MLVSDGISSTQELGPDGELLGEVPRRGRLAVDEAGNIYVALVAGGQVAVYSYTPDLTLRWSRVESIPTTGVLPIAANADGAIIALGNATIRRFPADGSASQQIGVSGTAVAVSRDAFVVVQAASNSVSITLHDLTGTTLWQTGFIDTISLSGVSLDLADRVVLAGHFSGSLDFGGPTLTTSFHGDSDINSFVAGFARADGTEVFTERIPAKVITGIAANGPQMVIAAEEWVTPIFPHLYYVGAGGGAVEDDPSTGFIEEWGRSGSVALGPTGRLYWEFSMNWPGPNDNTFPYLLAF